MKSEKEIKQLIKNREFDLHQIKCMYKNFFDINATIKVNRIENEIKLLKWIIEE